MEREIEQSNQSGKDMDEEIAQKKAEIEEKAAFIAEKEAESAACTKRLEELRQGMGRRRRKSTVIPARLTNCLRNPPRKSWPP